MYILAHDLGTSGNKATLFDESGLLIASRTAAYPTDYASGNRAEQNPHHWWKAIVDTTQALLELVSPNDIAGVALSGQMMGCLCVDKDGNPLRPHMLYCDQRSQEEEAKLTEKIDPLHFYEITGHRISASYSVGKEARTGNLCADCQNAECERLHQLPFVRYYRHRPFGCVGNQCLRFEPLAME